MFYMLKCPLRIFEFIVLQTFHKNINFAVNTGCASNNGGCSHFCFPKVGGHTCGCSLNVDLLSDGKTCEDGMYRNF